MELFQKISKQPHKKGQDSNIRRKRSLAKSPVLKYKKSKMKSRSQSKTVTKCFPSKGHSVYKQPPSKTKFSLFSQRNIEKKSKTFVTAKKDASGNSFRPKITTKGAQLRDIFEKKQTKTDWPREHDSDLRQKKTLKQGRNNSKDRQNNEIGMIAG